jgi:hypothetical protein
LEEPVGGFFNYHIHEISIGYSIPGHSLWKRMPWGESEMHSFSYTNDQVLYNQFSPYFLCRVSWLPIITNLCSLSQIRLNEYQLKSISFNYNICGIWKIFNNTRQRKYGLNWLYNTWSLVYEKECISDSPQGILFHRLWPGIE